MLKPLQISQSRRIAPRFSYTHQTSYCRRWILCPCQVKYTALLLGPLLWALCLSKRHHALIFGPVTLFTFTNQEVLSFIFIIFLFRIKMLMTEIASIFSYKTKPCRWAPPYSARVTSHTCWTGLTDRIFRQPVINGCALTVTHFRLFPFLLSCPLIVDSRGIELPITPCIRIFGPAPLQHAG
jgi:hypothetical protein